MDHENDIQTAGISEEKVRAVFRGVLERFIDDVIEGRVEMDSVLAGWLRRQRRLQSRVGEWIEKLGDEPKSP